MKELIEKILDRIQCLQKDKYVMSPVACYVLDRAIDIIKEEAKAYNESVKGDLISRSALLKELESSEIQPTKDTDGFIDGWCEGFNTVVDMIRDVPTAYNDGWIPCGERLPSKEEYLKNDGRIIVTDGNRVYQSIYDIYGQCFKTLTLGAFIDIGYRSSFEVDNCVIAWQPLPPAYQPKGENNV